MSEPDGGNLYRPHPLMIHSGQFWRCKHGTTGFASGLKWEGCDDCAKDDPEAFAKWNGKIDPSDGLPEPDTWDVPFPGHDGLTISVVSRDDYYALRAKAQALQEQHKAIMRNHDEMFAEYIASNNSLHRQLEAALERERALRETLQELVTLKDMHDKIERMAPQDLSDPRNYRAEELQEQYQQRKPKAWAEARAALGAKP
jgi:hypothetical protein